jgi:hypothetical protein
VVGEVAGFGAIGAVRAGPADGGVDAPFPEADELGVLAPSRSRAEAGL